ncbi:hypothetical protein [Solibacillus sp. FSL W8-0372]|uniref:hypothetical protein n=1 Tax=Solibacillus sp. FSL W8-0372 TaxID=2921713 RepID=UPI0030D31E85
MQNLLKNEWYKIKLPFSITFLFSILIVCITTLITYKTYQVEQQLEVYELGFQYFGLFYALVAVVPTAWLMYFERKTHFIKYTLPRVKQRTYILLKVLVSMTTGFIIVFGISITSLIVALYVVPPVPPIISSFDSLTGEPISVREMRIFGEMFVKHPFLYGFISSIWKGIIGSLVALFGFVLSLYSQNLFVILTGPFLYTILENYCLSVFGLEEYRLITAFEPSSIWVKDLSWLSFVVGPILLIIVIFCYGLYMQFVAKKSVYEQ